MSKRTATDQEVPAKQFVLYDPRTPVIQGNLPSAERAKDIPTFKDENLGKCTIIQAANNDGQGYYLAMESGKYGNHLIKHLVHVTEIGRLMKLYSGMGLIPLVAEEHRWTEEEKNTKREIVFSRQLIHDHITNILAFISPTGKTEDINAILMEGASLGTLEAYSQKGQLPDLAIKKYALQLSDALRYCHEEHHLIHRDVRPKNIYVHSNGDTIKIGNFGYANTVGEDEAMITANKGDDINYKAPEIISNNPANITVYSYPVDVYSYGLVIWSIAHQGSTPFSNIIEDEDEIDHATFREYLESNNDNRPAIREDLGINLADLIRTCWVNLDNGRNTRPTMAKIVTSLQ